MVLVLVLLPALAGVARRRRARPGRARRRRQPRLDAGAHARQGRRCSSRSCWSSGTRVVPWLLEQVARTGSRELFTLARAGDRARHRLRLGRAVRRVVRARRVLRRHGAERVRAQPPRGRRGAAAAATPSRCCSSSRSACCSTRRSWCASRCAVLAVLLVIVVGKSLAAFAIVLAFGYPLRDGAARSSASLAQIGEFSFILAGLGVVARPAAAGGPRPDPGRRAPLDHAQPAGVRRGGSDRLARPGWATRRAAGACRAPQRQRPMPAGASPGSRAGDHAVIVGYGRVGRSSARV